MKFSAKNKIVVVCLIWLVISLLMFFYLFNILDSSNQSQLAEITKNRTTLATLQAEDNSYKKAQSDLKDLAAKTYQPESFFSRDINFIVELNTLQDLSKKYNIIMALGGISGTVGAAPQAHTTSPVAIVPFSLSLTGSLADVVSFLENMENLSFITKVSTISLSSADKGMVNASLTANFYLKK